MSIVQTWSAAGVSNVTVTSAGPDAATSEITGAHEDEPHVRSTNCPSVSVQPALGR